MLRDRSWKLKYTPEDGDLVERFYVPALEDAERYDRITGYFTAGALALAARGIEGLVRNDGRMRLIVGCTLAQPEIDAVEQGARLREQVEARLAALPLAPPDAAAEDALELLAWMVASGRLEMKVAVPCGPDRAPVFDEAVFHEKTGIVEDRTGDRVAWTGSLNETVAGWQRNWESIGVYTSWGPEPGRVEAEEAGFARLWADRARRAVVIDAPEAARRDLLRFLPDDAPRRLGGARPPPDRADPPPAPAPPPADRRALVWGFIAQAPRMEPGGSRVGEATAAVTPWPHQVRAFERLYAAWPPRLLIADEVGLGKTVQAGMLLRQAWLSGRAKRVLILAPKAVLGQWQVELREKFNLNWPIYDGRRLTWRRSPALAGGDERAAGRDEWHREPAVIVSSQLMRRADRAAELLEEAEPWDVVVLDEAHHARRRGAGTGREGGPNALLALMRRLEERACGLVLLTATPMQVHPVELWDLLDLLGLPPEWTEEAFLRFFEDLASSNPSAAAFARMARLFQAAERVWGPAGGEAEDGLAGLSRLRSRKVMRALRDRASIPLRQLETAERRAALDVLRAGTPVRHLVSRHTRDLLRRYFRAGMLGTPVAERRVEDRFIPMTAAEGALYAAVEDHISATCARAGAAERAAVGFVMTVYRRRLASSFRALRATLERRLASLEGASAPPDGLDEDAPDDETADIPDAEEVAAMERRALEVEERAGIEDLLRRVRALPADGKLARLTETLAGLRCDGYAQAMVFTQYADTMDFLRGALGGARLMCFSGRGGEVPAPGGGVADHRPRRGPAAVPGRRGGRPALHRRRRRRAELPVLRRLGQLRHAVEPDAGRTADRAHRPAGPGAPGDPHRQPALRRHGGDRRLPRAAPTDRAVRERGRRAATDPLATAEHPVRGGAGRRRGGAGGGGRGGREAGAGGRGGRLRHRRGHGRRPGLAGPGAGAGRARRPRPGDRRARPDAARLGRPAAGAPRIRPDRPRHGGAGAGDHRPGVLRGERGQRRAVVAGQPAVRAAGVPGPGGRAAASRRAQGAPGTVTSRRGTPLPTSPLEGGRSATGRTRERPRRRTGRRVAAVFSPPPFRGEVGRGVPRAGAAGGRRVIPPTPPSRGEKRGRGGGGGPSPGGAAAAPLGQPPSRPPPFQGGGEQTARPASLSGHRERSPTGPLTPPSGRGGRVKAESQVRSPWGRSGGGLTRPAARAGVLPTASASTIHHPLPAAAPPPGAARP